ncbi:hypothetical protein T4D_4001 [Trichinella pseudospiralis]|uniref:Uncharacterized protein n=1 Tax=Trichinella pseudospiralis TaxID=6337 RepID=A0A0V1G035_TRIPS|nr:hypothetical protein T4D_4001 [Trichinella pseudospiralis]
MNGQLSEMSLLIKTDIIKYVIEIQDHCTVKDLVILIFEQEVEVLSKFLNVSETSFVYTIAAQQQQLYFSGFMLECQQQAAVKKYLDNYSRLTLDEGL